MAKSAWKFLNTNKNQIYRYMYDLKLIQKMQGLQKIEHLKNNMIINNINFMHRYMFHLGNCFVNKRFYFYTIRSKSLEFLKFKKPFSFRPKKKK